MTAEQMEELKEFVDPDMLGLDLFATLNLTFSFKRKGEEKDSELNLDDFCAYLHEHYGLSEQQANQTWNDMAQAIEDQADVAMQELHQALQQALEEVLDEDNTSKTTQS